MLSYLNYCMCGDGLWCSGMGWFHDSFLNLFPGTWHDEIYAALVLTAVALAASMVIWIGVRIGESEYGW